MDVISFSEASTANGRIESFIENPDSTSGIVTVPKTIASGETITIPAGRVAVLPNVQVDGVINIEGEVFIPSGATFGDLDAQIALKADTSYVNTQLGLKANTADLKEIGVGQTWQDLTASRVSGTTYTNTTGKPIFLLIFSTNGNFTGTLNINGISTLYGSPSASYYAMQSVQIVIPNNNTYAVTFTDSGLAHKWLELR